MSGNDAVGRAHRHAKHILSREPGMSYFIVSLSAGCLQFIYVVAMTNWQSGWKAIISSSCVLHDSDNEQELVHSGGLQLDKAWKATLHREYMKLGGEKMMDFD